MYIRHIVLYTYTIYYTKSVPKSVKISEKILKKDFGKILKKGTIPKGFANFAIL